jgi:magnesium transporter
MLTIYETRSGALVSQKGQPRVNEETVWIDLINPTSDEEKIIEGALGLDVPTRVKQDRVPA